MHTCRVQHTICSSDQTYRNHVYYLFRDKAPEWKETPQKGFVSSSVIVFDAAKLIRRGKKRKEISNLMIFSLASANTNKSFTVLLFSLSTICSITLAGLLCFDHLLRLFAPRLVRNITFVMNFGLYIHIKQWRILFSLVWYRRASVFFTTRCRTFFFFTLATWPRCMHSHYLVGRNVIDRIFSINVYLYNVRCGFGRAIERFTYFIYLFFCFILLTQHKALYGSPVKPFSTLNVLFSVRNPL